LNKILKWLIGIIVFIFAVYFFAIKSRLPIISSYAAKTACGCYFNSGLPLSKILKEDLNYFPINLVSVSLNEESMIMNANVLGLANNYAIFKKNIGCVLLKGKDDYQVENNEIVNTSESVDSLYHLDRIYQLDNVDYSKLNEAVSGFFDQANEAASLKTRAVLVIHKDSLIAEKYDNGISSETPLLGWSMTKSVMNTLIGILVKAGKLEVNQSHLFKEWSDDDRANITLENLLRMNTGLSWEEDYSKVSDVTKLLYLTENVVAEAIDNPLEYKIGEHWCYSSGTSNLVSGLIRKQFATLDEYLDFPYQALFQKIGMNSAIIETDESGNYIGSSYMYATAKDWAKYGLLYLHRGKIGDEQLFNPEWTDFSFSETENSEGIYGAHFWINKRNLAYPDVPVDLYSANGYQGQRIFIIPSKDVVVVRLGLNQDVNFNHFLKGILDAIED
jgi:CubicO group peptidase (beta-lactamase class C family)